MLPFRGCPMKRLLTQWLLSLSFSLSLRLILTLNLSLNLILSLCLSLLSASAPVQAAPLAPEEVPPPLREWTDWVLWSDPRHGCPRLNGVGEGQGRSCV